MTNLGVERLLQVSSRVREFTTANLADLLDSAIDGVISINLSSTGTREASDLPI